MSVPDLDTAYRACLDWRSPAGRLVIADLANACHMGDAGPTPDPLELARREGRRALFIYIAGRLGLPLIPEA